MKLHFDMISKNITFKSGISNLDLKHLNKIPLKKTEEYFEKTLGINTDFKGNQTFCAINLLCKSILNKIGDSKVFGNLSLKSNPSNIRVFNKQELVKNFPNTFCTQVTKKIIQDETPYKPISMFIYNDRIAIDEMNEMVEIAARDGFISNDNFLAFIMHEWAHCVHLNNLYEKNNFNEQKVAEQIRKLKQIELSDKEKVIIREFLGEYVYNDGDIRPMEVVAEGLNKIVCSCLNRQRVAISDSIDDVVQRMPREFIAVMKKFIQQ